MECPIYGKDFEKGDCAECPITGDCEHEKHVLSELIGLLDCPFCGARASEDEVHLRPKKHRGQPVELNGMKFWYIECLDCDARTGNHWDGDAELLGYADGKQMAAGHWNRRAN